MHVCINRHTTDKENLNILQANCLLLSHTQLYLQLLSENAGNVTHEQGLACSQNVNMDLIVELFHPSLPVYLYFPGAEVITVFPGAENFSTLPFLGKR